jgi:enoyl-CoA hydratase/carnithine racemase
MNNITQARAFSFFGECASIIGNMIGADMKPAVIAMPHRLDEPSVCTMIGELEAATEAAAVVLEGEPGRFCLGMDFVTAARPGVSISGLRRSLEAFARCLELLMGSPRPTLAVVDGPALGGGLGMAAACDVVIATDRARFGLPEALYGLAPAIIRPALLTRLSPQQLNFLLFTCYSRSTVEAAELGLVDQVVAVEELPNARRRVLRQLRRAASGSVAASRRWSAGAVQIGLRAGIDETAATLSDARVREALVAAIADEDVPWSR